MGSRILTAAAAAAAVAWGAAAPASAQVSDRLVADFIDACVVGMGSEPGTEDIDLTAVCGCLADTLVAQLSPADAEAMLGTAAVTEPGGDFETNLRERTGMDDAAMQAFQQRVMPVLRTADEQCLPQQ